MPEWLEITLIGAACVVSFLVVAIPSGRMVEDHTNQPVMRWFWYWVLGTFAFFVFVGMSGVGDFYMQVARTERERGGNAFAGPQQGDDGAAGVGKPASRDPAPAGQPKPRASGSDK
jgi:hypothetical protein